MGIQGNGVIIDSTAASASVFGLFYLLYILVVSFMGIGSYVLQSLAYYRIASRRGIKHAWLSWIPVGSIWILGCISDQYQYVVKRQIKNKRKTFLILGLVSLGFAILVVVLAGVMIGTALAFDYIYNGNNQLIGGFFGSVFGISVVLLLMSALSIAMVILQYICLYDLFTSCDPSNNITYLILSIFLGFLQPVLLFICRNKDEGMPPRKAAQAQIPVEPWERPENQE